MTVTERAPAKLNLALHVRRRRADGYHDLETLFAFAADGDAVTVARGEGETRLTLTGPFAPLLTADGDNLVLRAERAFREAFGIAAAHAITLDKHLPVASGIGGGSADAAATLRALARLHGTAGDPRLVAIARALGADVPACLAGTPAFGTGRGDELLPVAGLGDAPALLVNPGVGVSTAAVFAGWDGQDRGALDPADWRTGRNDLQPPAERVAPVVTQVVTLLAAQPGATLARMSGSGATCFALFDTPAARDAADAAVAAAQPGWWRLATVVR